MLVKPRGQEAAEALRHELGLGYGPIDVFAVIGALGYELYRGRFPDDNVDGALRQQGGVRFVLINSAVAITRQRFTAAHELGHARLEPLTDGTEFVENNVESAAGANGDEREANIFAAYLLMDARGVRDLVEKLPDERQRVAAVASVFMVSPKTAAIHLRDLGLISNAALNELCVDLDQGWIKPQKLLDQYGYKMAATDQLPAAERLDPAHRARALRFYREEGFTLAGLADALALTIEETRALLRRERIEIRDDLATADSEPDYDAVIDLGKELG